MRSAVIKLARRRACAGCHASDKQQGNSALATRRSQPQTCDRRCNQAARSRAGPLSFHAPARVRRRRLQLHRSEPQPDNITPRTTRRRAPLLLAALRSHARTASQSKCRYMNIPSRRAQGRFPASWRTATRTSTRSTSRTGASAARSPTGSPTSRLRTSSRRARARPQ